MRLAFPSNSLCLLVIFAAFLPTARAATPLKPRKEILLPKTTGKFDFLTLDPNRHRLLVAHTGNGSLDVIDLVKNELIKSILTGAAQSSAANAKEPLYYAGISKPPQLVVINAEMLSVTVTVPLTGPADIIAFNQKSGLVYVGHDDEKELWVVDPKSGKVVTTIDLPSDSPEDLAFDRSYNRLFQNMKTASVVLVIDTASNKVVQSWPTAPVEGPHGLAIDPEAETLLVAGGNGKLVMMSQKDGHVMTSAAIPERVDQIAYDPANHRLYCASGTGKIAVLDVQKEGLTSLGTVPCPAGTHSIAVDAATHEVWIAFAREKESFVQPFTAVP